MTKDCKDIKPTGWDKGLSQDYCKGLAQWFASRMDAKAVVMRWYGDQRTERNKREL